MSQPRTYHLIGLTDPGAMSLGFLVALFTDGRSNAPLVQRIVGEVVDGFEPYEVPDAPIIPKTRDRTRDFPASWRHRTPCVLIRQG
jgi:hypothetical protein